jgi:hypothetical protein
VELRRRKWTVEKVLLKQLQLKFGQLSEGVLQRVRTASAAEVELWAERVLTGSSIEDVLGG